MTIRFGDCCRDGVAIMDAGDVWGEDMRGKQVFALCRNSACVPWLHGHELEEVPLHEAYPTNDIDDYDYDYEH